MKKAWWVVIAVVVVVVLYGVGVYNSLVGKNEGIDGQWAQVETQYQRRLDLIPNLVESVKGAMKQEQTIFTALADARTRYGNSVGTDAKAKAASEVESAFGRLLAVMENYPQLKSSDTVQTLMAQLEGTENRVSVERQRFNDAVRSLNVATKTFPSSLIASMAGFAEREYFEAADGAENAPKVNL